MSNMIHVADESNPIYPKPLRLSDVHKGVPALRVDVVSGRFVPFTFSSEAFIHYGDLMAKVHFVDGTKDEEIFLTSYGIIPSTICEWNRTAFCVHAGNIAALRLWLKSKNNSD